MQGLAHGNIKLENLLIDSSPHPLLTICSCGHARHIQCPLQSRIGAPSEAPEITLDKASNNDDMKVRQINLCSMY